MSVTLENSLQIELSDLAFESAGETGVHCGAAAEHDVLVELGPDVDVGRLDRVEEQFGDADAFAVREMRLEEDLWCFEPLAAEFYHSTVRKLFLKEIITSFLTIGIRIKTFQGPRFKFFNNNQLNSFLFNLKVYLINFTIETR